MGTVVYAVSKSKKRTIQGLGTSYQITGKCMEHWKCGPGMAFYDKTALQAVAERAHRAWGNERPQYGYMDWTVSDPDWTATSDGLNSVPIFKLEGVKAFREQHIENLVVVGRAIKRGRVWVFEPGEFEIELIELQKPYARSITHFIPEEVHGI